MSDPGRTEELDREALYRLMAEEVFRDGILGESEKSMLQRLARFLRLEPEQARSLTREARDRHRRGELGESRGLDPVQLFEQAVKLALADGTLGELETQLLKGLARLLGLVEDRATALLDKGRLEAARTCASSLPAARPPSRAGQPEPAARAGGPGLENPGSKIGLAPGELQTLVPPGFSAAAGQPRTGQPRPAPLGSPDLETYVRDEDLTSQGPDLPPRRFAVGSWGETAFYAKDVLIGAGLLVGMAVLAVSSLVSDEGRFRVVTLPTGRLVREFHAPLLVAAFLAGLYGIRRLCGGLLRWARVSPRVDRFTRIFPGVIAFLAGPDRFHQ